MAQILTAVGAIAIPITFALVTYKRRPSLALEEDTERVQSWLEGERREWPHVRLLVSNKGWRRAGHGTRVIVEGYRRQGETRMTTLGSPLLGWPSAPELPDGGLSIFPGLRRPIDFGSLVPVRRDAEGRHVEVPTLLPDGRQIFLPQVVRVADGGRWELKLGLAFSLIIADRREYLESDAWIVTLTVGADDGSAKTYDVHVGPWVADEPDAEKVLTDLLDRLEVVEA